MAGPITGGRNKGWLWMPVASVRSGRQVGLRGHRHMVLRTCPDFLPLHPFFFRDPQSSRSTALDLYPRTSPSPRDCLCRISGERPHPPRTGTLSSWEVSAGARWGLDVLDWSCPAQPLKLPPCCPMLCAPLQFQVNPGSRATSSWSSAAHRLRPQLSSAAATQCPHLLPYPSRSPALRSTSKASNPCSPGRDL